MFKLITCLLEFIGSCPMCLGGWRGLIVAVSSIAVPKPSAPFPVAWKWDLFASVLVTNH